MLGKARVITRDKSQEYFFREGCHILELWNDAADADVSIARARVEPGKTTRGHRLIDTIERYVILEGNGEFFSADSSALVTPGDVVVIPAGESQSIRNTADCDLIFLAICSPRFEEHNYCDGAPN